MKIRFCLSILCALLLMPYAALAQDARPFTQDELIALVGEAVVEEAASASEAVRKAKEVLDAVRARQGTTQEQRQAERDMDSARMRYAKAQKDLDNARVNAFAEQSGKSPAEIQSMRDSGMGWGLIAKESGIHPSASGKGKGQSKNKKKGQGQATPKKK